MPIRSYQIHSGQGHENRSELASALTPLAAARETDEVARAGLAFPRYRSAFVTEDDSDRAGLSRLVNSAHVVALDVSTLNCFG